MTPVQKSYAVLIQFCDKLLTIPAVPITERRELFVKNLQSYNSLSENKRAILDASFEEQQESFLLNPEFEQPPLVVFGNEEYHKSTLNVRRDCFFFGVAVGAVFTALIAYFS